MATAAATFVPVIYNNTNFTVGNFTVGAKAVTIDTTPQNALTTEYWLGGFSGGSGVWAASDGSANSNWAADTSGTATPLIPGPTATVVFSAAGATGQGGMTLGANMAIGGLISNDSNPVKLNNDANGDTLTIDAGGITVGSTNSGAGAVTINAPLRAKRTAILDQRFHLCLDRRRHHQQWSESVDHCRQRLRRHDDQRQHDGDGRFDAGHQRDHRRIERRRDHSAGHDRSWLEHVDAGEPFRCTVRHDFQPDFQPDHEHRRRDDGRRSRHRDSQR